MARPPLHIGCKVKGCEKKHSGLGYCRKHYLRFKKNGSTELKTPEERFHENYEIITETGCWIWMGTVNAGGYGLFGAKGLQGLAHRFSWKLHLGPIPNGLFVCHKCDVPSCVNPEHLFVCTTSDNMQDAIKKGRKKYKSGQVWNRSNLTWDDIPTIKKKHKDGLSYAKIAKQYGVSENCIFKICKNRTWKEKPKEGLNGNN